MSSLFEFPNNNPTTLFWALGITSILGISLSWLLKSSDKKSEAKKSRASKFPRRFTGSLQELSLNGPLKAVSQSLQDPAKYALSLVIPAFNEEKRLGPMLADALPVLEEQKERSEVILVDDGSRDGTCAAYCQLVKAYQLKRIANGKKPSQLSFKLLKLPVNSGKGHAVSEGFLAAGGELILFADADGSTQFGAVNEFKRQIKQLASANKESILICGSRASAVSKSDVQVKRTLFRWILMQAFHAFLKLFGVRSVNDTQCGFKMMTRSAARLVCPWLHISGWIFDVEMILLAEAKGVQVLEVPVPWREMDGTKLSLAFDSFKMARDLLRLRMNYLLGIWKYK